MPTTASGGRHSNIDGVGSVGDELLDGVRVVVVLGPGGLGEGCGVQKCLVHWWVGIILTVQFCTMQGKKQS
jgi:S-adenosylhomocysteine hydrolase